MGLKGPTEEFSLSKHYFFQVMEQRQGKGITGLECKIFVTNLVLAFAFIYGPQKHEKIMPVLQASS